MAAPRSPSRNVTVRGHRTSLRLEPEVFQALDEICIRERTTLPVLCNRLLDRNRESANLSSLLRVYALSYFKAMAALPPLPAAQDETVARRRSRRQPPGIENQPDQIAA